jgi:hypothetical protein
MTAALLLRHSELSRTNGSAAAELRYVDEPAGWR